MATSGTEKTRIGASISGVGIKLTITAKSVAALVTTKLRGFTQNVGRMIK